MSGADVQRLLEEQTAAIQLTDERAEQLKKFKSDYEALHKRLHTLPDKLTHDVMVPFGKLAFMPGQLVHTNEIMVLLGDNWFVDRSACQACSIIDRRIEVLDGQLDELSKQRGLLEPRKQFTEELWDVGQEEGARFEIREEFDEKKEMQWREKHKESMKRYREQQRIEAAEVTASPEAACLTDAELWARLDTLEDDERAGGEMHRLDEERDHALPETRPPVSSVSERGWDAATHAVHSGGMRGSETPQEKAQADNDNYNEEEDSDDDDDDDYGDDEEEDSGPDDTEPQPATSIRFSHTPTEAAPLGTQEGGDAAGWPIITSPADVYRHFAPRGPPSILRAPGVPSSGRAPSPGTTRRVTITEPARPKPNAPAAPARTQPLSVGSKAFSGSIVEHVEPIGTEVLEQQAEPPRMSRFKERRLQQQNR